MAQSNAMKAYVEWRDRPETTSITDGQLMYNNADKLLDDAKALASHALILGNHLNLVGRIWPLV